METELQDIVPNICSGKDRISNSGEVALYGSTGVIGRTNSASYKENIVLVARVGANAGQMQIGNAPCGVTDNTLVIDAKEWNYYIYYFLQHYNLNRLVFGSGQPLITGGMLKRIKVRYGCKAERNNITRLLCLIDERIATQNKIIEKLESLIKGIADKLFQTARETKLLLELAPNITSGTDKNGSGTIPLYGSTGIIGKVKNASQKGNIVLVARVGTIGTVQYVKEPCGVSDNALIVEAGEMTKYIYHFLKTYKFAHITSGTTQPLITASSLKKIAVPTYDIERQTQIVLCLNILERKLDIEKQYLSDIAMMKQYLLHQMFI
ncbi:MAG: restriction endonuclease subunit S [Butyricimonas virosa]|uniref:restriction endonuclease subunit S n=1 Tax=Butyricimonas virosa TaxID=544645 RepID=UPI002A91CFB3|nr:restriction endonuclease subunit S [Butyricimonas virosa]MDY5533642.1 restriction endonuclease subunit S [Butyricimonas virosa]